MSMFERHPKDNIGKWFEQRKKLGVSDAIYWGRYKPESNRLTMHEFHHAYGDGMSTMKQMLVDAGHHDVMIPLCREASLPTREQFKKIKENIRPYPKKVKWLFWQADNKQTQNTLNTLLFNKEETKIIQQRAKSLGVPVTTLVLWALNRSAAKYLLQPTQEYSWFYPVNLRGLVDFKTDYANYSSGFYLPLNAEISIQALHERIRKKLKSGEHWLNWYQANISRYLPGIVIRWLYKFISQRQFYAGNFSAMGDWFNDADSTLPKCKSRSQDDLSKERWLCFAPGTKNYPISSSIITWHGELSLNLKLHPSIVKNEDVALETLCGWGECLLEGGRINPQEAKEQKRIISYTYSDD
jgi:GR25 family glycosyltransferase involved in LPS biosynthesis